jgi:hypothetical protein
VDHAWHHVAVTLYFAMRQHLRAGRQPVAEGSPRRAQVTRRMLDTWSSGFPCSASFLLTETEQALRIEVRDLFLVIHVDGHLIKELPSGFHVAVGIVRGEDDAVNADRVRHAQIGLVRQTPAAVHRARLLAYVLTGEDSTVEVLSKVFLDGPFQSTVLA